MTPRIPRIRIRTCIGTTGTNRSMMVTRFRYRDDQSAVRNAFGGDQRIGDLLHILGFATQHDYLQAVVVIQVYMQSRNNALVVLVLQFGQLFVEEPDMVIVNNRDCPHYGRVGFLCLLPNQLRTRQVAECLRPVGVAFLLHELIELVQQLAFNGHAETPQIGHKTDCIGLPRMPI